MKERFLSHRPACRNFNSVKTRGMSIAEVVVASGIAALMLVAIAQAFTAYENAQSRQSPAIKAQLLSEEGVEVLHLLRNTGWNVLSTIPAGTKRYIYFSGSVWSVTTTPEIIDGMFYRSFMTASTSRNSSFNIVSSGGTVDPQTLLATVSVSYPIYGATSSVSYSDYFFNY